MKGPEAEEGDAYPRRGEERRWTPALEEEKIKLGKSNKVLNPGGSETLKRSLIL